jgi:hypothetical protein
MPLRTFLAGSPHSCTEEELRGWRQLLLLEPEPEDAGATAILEAAEIRASLLRRSEWDEHAVGVINTLCPHWPPLRTRSMVERARLNRCALDPLADPDDAHWASLGLDPSLPWDSFMAGSHSIPTLLLEEMERQRATSFLQLSLNCRIAAERFLDGSWADPSHQLLAEMWLAAKACHNGSSLQPPSLWDLPTVLQEESLRVARHLASVGPPHLPLPLFLRTYFYPPSRCLPDGAQPLDPSLGVPLSPEPSSPLWAPPPSPAVTPLDPISQAPPPGPRRTRRGARGKRLPAPHLETQPSPSPPR